MLSRGGGGRLYVRAAIISQELSKSSDVTMLATRKVEIKVDEGPKEYRFVMS